MSSLLPQCLSNGRMGFIACAFLLLQSFGMQAQVSEVDQILAHTHGIQNNGGTFYEVEGYQLYVSDRAIGLNEKGIKKLRKENKIKKEAIGMIEPNISFVHEVYYSNDSTGSVAMPRAVYFVSIGENTTRVFDFIVFEKRDHFLEILLINKIMDQSLPTSAYTSMNLDSLAFAGRVLPLGSVCHWMKPHNVQCSGLGQINWGEYRTEERAQLMVMAQYTITAEKKMGEVISETKVPVVFEGVETEALRVHYKIKLPELIVGGSNELIIYYITCPVRNRYIGIVMSHYTDEAAEGQLPLLLSEFMSLK